MGAAAWTMDQDASGRAAKRSKYSEDITAFAAQDSDLLLTADSGNFWMDNSRQSSASDAGSPMFLATTGDDETFDASPDELKQLFGECPAQSDGVLKAALLERIPLFRTAHGWQFYAALESCMLEKMKLEDITLLLRGMDENPLGNDQLLSPSQSDVSACIP